MNNCERFFELLQWAVERKDFEDFWPVGLESTGPRYWSQLAMDLYFAKNEIIKPDYPTANIALAFCLIYGVRELEWSSEQFGILFDRIFESAQDIKVGDIFNSNGANIIWDTQYLMDSIKNSVSIADSNISFKDMYALSGQILALSEAEYFMNHRIGTEKHGPYLMSDGDICIVRSFKNLHPIELWPELCEVNLFNNEGHIIFKYSNHEVKFDVLSNLITPLPPIDKLKSISIVKNDVYHTFTKEQFNDFSSSICQGIYILEKKIQKMTNQQKSEQMTKILYYGCRNCLEEWDTQAQIAIEKGRTYSIKHPVPVKSIDRLSYYNLTT